MEALVEHADQILLYVAILAATAFVAGYAGYRLWRRYNNDDQEPSMSAGFSLHDLRVMHREGNLTDEEFEQAKALIIGRTKAQPDAEATESRDNEPSQNSIDPGITFFDDDENVETEDEENPPDSPGK